MRRSDLVSLSVGWSSVCATSAGGETECFGYLAAASGATGSNPIHLLNPGVVMAFSDIAQLAIGQDSACIRNAAGQVECLGGNTCGGLGDGSTASRWSAGVVPL